MFNLLKSYLIPVLDITSQLELGKPIEKHKPEKRLNGIFWILLINLGIYVADHIFQVVFNLEHSVLYCLSKVNWLK